MADSPKAPPKGQAKADVDPVLQEQLKALQTAAREDAEKRTLGQQVKWLMPEKKDWSGSMFDYDGMAKPFDRKKSNDDFVEAVKDPKSPGTTGDLIVTSLQVDYLAVLERSFRSRHTMTWPRIICHATGRRSGHGNDKGPLTQCVLEYIRGLVRESKDGGGGQ